MVTHPHADHSAGLEGLIGRMPIDLVWSMRGDHETQESLEVLEGLRMWGASIVTPLVGDRYDLGKLALAVHGPLRRYASPNDESIVVLAHGPRRSMLLTGDVEEIAQDELDGLDADVLKVPHHGAATSDPEWLVGIGADLAVISVGVNDFGHPAPVVIDALESAGTDVARTDLDGDVIVELG